MYTPHTERIIRMSIFEGNAAEQQVAARFDEKYTNQNAQRYGHEHWMEERVASDQNSQYTENQLQYPKL